MTSCIDGTTSKIGVAKPSTIDLFEAIDNPVKQMLLSDVAEDIEIVPLETTNESVLDLNRKMISFNEAESVLYFTLLILFS